MLRAISIALLSSSTVRDGRSVSIRMSGAILSALSRLYKRFTMVMNSLVSAGLICFDRSSFKYYK